MEPQTPNQTPPALDSGGISSFIRALGQQSQQTAQQPSGSSSLNSMVQGGYQAPTAPAVDPASIQAYAKQKSDSMFGPGHFDSLYKLINNESGWNPNAQNPGSSAYGLGQFLDSTWQGVGAQKTSDPQAQVDATLKYIANRYGTPTNALNFWENVAPTQSAGGGSHWY